MFYCLKIVRHSLSWNMTSKIFLLLSVSLSHLSWFHFFSSFTLQVSLGSWFIPDLLFLSHLISKLAVNPRALEWKYIQNLTISVCLHGYHLGSSQSFPHLHYGNSPLSWFPSLSLTSTISSVHNRQSNSFHAISNQNSATLTHFT